MKQPIAIGVENYKRIIDKNAYFVDKTMMIKELVDQASSVNLFTRPRRFGKTLTLSMIRTFFEDEKTYEGENLVLSPYNPRKSVIIFEFKSCKKYNQMAAGCKAALDQIEEKDYAAPFLDKGYTKIMKYGICFCEKTCMVEVEK